MAKDKQKCPKSEINKMRVRRVFDEFMDIYRQGRKPNLSDLMRKHGYAASSVKSLKVLQTKAWEECKDRLNDTGIAARMERMALGEIKDAGYREQLEAGKTILKVKNRFPKEDKTGDVPELKLIIERKKPKPE